jgi:hypothetical protein
LTTHPLAFYCVAEDRYFPGAVAMLNSLQLVGHDEPLFMLDCGLTAEQRELLSPHATLVEAPTDAPPWLLKTIAPLRHPADVMVLIDADLIVTRPLTELAEDAGAGGVVAFETSYDRFFPEWGELLDLGRVRRGPYLCSALVLAGGEVGERAIRLLDEAQKRIPELDDNWSGGRREFFETAAKFPFSALDQDVLNAVLSSAHVADERVRALDHRLAPEPPFPELALVDPQPLRCEYDDGTQPYALHHLGPKPWIAAVRENLYTRLLVRLLTGPGIALRVPEAELPLRLREGRLAGGARRLAGVRDRLRTSVWEPLSWRLGPRLDALSGRRGPRRDRSRRRP